MRSCMVFEHQESFCQVIGLQAYIVFFLDWTGGCMRLGLTFAESQDRNRLLKSPL